MDWVTNSLSGLCYPVEVIVGVSTCPGTKAVMRRTLDAAPRCVVWLTL